MSGTCNIDLDYLRLIVLDERGSGKLSEIPDDVYSEALEYLSELYSEASSIDHFMTERGSELLNEIESVQATLQDITNQRIRKIIKLAEIQADCGKTDKEELKRMLPPEKEMYDKILLAIGECRKKFTEPEFLRTTKKSAAVNQQITARVDEEILSEDYTSDIIPHIDDILIKEPENESKSEFNRPEKSGGIEYEPVYIIENIDSFMGIDGRIYNLSAEDIVTLPRINADVLYNRNIALNIGIGK
jgi:DNA replication factor GINS